MGEVQRATPLIGTVEPLEPPAEPPGGNFGLNVPDGVVQRLLQEHRLVPPGDRALGEGRAPAPGYGNRALVPLGEPDRQLVVVVPAAALPADHDLHRLLEHIEQPAVLPHARSGSRLRCRRSRCRAWHSGWSRCPSSGPGHRAIRWRCCRMHGLATFSSTEPPDSATAGVMVSSTGSGPRGEVDRRCGDATALEAQRHAHRRGEGGESSTE